MKYLIDEVQIQNVINNILLEMSLQLLSVIHTEEYFPDFTFNNNYLSFQSYSKKDGRLFVDFESDKIYGAIRDYSGQTENMYVGDDIDPLLSDLPKTLKEKFKNNILPFLEVQLHEHTEEKIGPFKKKKIITTNKPVITTLFWTDGGSLYSCHQNLVFKKNGGQFLYDFNCSHDDYYTRMLQENELTNIQKELLLFLYTCKKQKNAECIECLIHNFGAKVELSKEFINDVKHFMNN